MSKTFVIAEAACTWLHGGLEAAYRSIKAAKECGADAWKTQWTSNARKMAQSRWDGSMLDVRFMAVDEMAQKYKRLEWDRNWLRAMRDECEKVGIEFMVTAFIVEDIEAVDPYVKRFKVSAFESKNVAFGNTVMETGREAIISANPGQLRWGGARVKLLHCVSEYPTVPERAQLSTLGECRATSDGLFTPVYRGLSDHTNSVLTGAVAVGSGRCEVIEKHVRLSDTPSTDPDYGHSLLLDKPDMECFYCLPDRWCKDCTATHGTGFAEYVSNIREAERML
jgi:N,N'-diacetyllegionaminate synthase